MNWPDGLGVAWPRRQVVNRRSPVSWQRPSLRCRGAKRQQQQQQQQQQQHASPRGALHSTRERRRRGWKKNVAIVDRRDQKALCVHHVVRRPAGPRGTTRRWTLELSGAGEHAQSRAVTSDWNHGRRRCGLVGQQITVPVSVTAVPHAGYAVNRMVWASYYFLFFFFFLEGGGQGF